MRRVARLLHIHYITVARKLRFLSQQASKLLDNDLKNKKGLKAFQFDDLETFEHTKCKPLSVTLAVSLDERKILAFEVSSMPAKGPLAKLARRKYGHRADHRKRNLIKLLKRLKPILEKDCLVTSDQAPYYCQAVQGILPKAFHTQVKSRRGCVTGQGELKKIGFDPLFSLNHTCAMLRANINRLFRRTWCTTKKPQALADHLAIYALYHNQVLTASAAH